MKKFFVIAALVVANVLLAQQFKEVVLIDGLQKPVSTKGNTNACWAALIAGGPSGGTFVSIVTNSAANYTNASLCITSRFATIGATAATLVWRATCGPSSDPATLSWQYSLNGKVWETGSSIELTPGTNGVWTQTATNLTLNEYGYLRISGLDNQNTDYTSTNDVRIYFKANN